MSNRTAQRDPGIAPCTEAPRNLIERAVRSPVTVATTFLSQTLATSNAPRMLRQSEILLLKQSKQEIAARSQAKQQSAVTARALWRFSRLAAALMAFFIVIANSIELKARLSVGVALIL